MTDDRYQGMNLEGAVEQLARGGNGDQGGEKQGGVLYRQETEETTPTYSHETVKNNHTRGKGRISDFVNRLLGREKYDLGKVDEIGKKSAQDLLSVGIDNIEKLPVVARPYYVRIMNYVNGDPKKRFKTAENGLDSLLEGFEAINKDMTKELYGPSYESMKKPVGGLYGKLNELASSRKDYGDAVLVLEDEIKEANSRMESTRQALTNSVDAMAKKDLTDTVLGIRFDIEKYERTKKELISEWKGVGMEIHTITDEVKAVKLLQSYVQDLSGKVRETKAAYRQTKRNTDYTSTIIPLVERFNHTLEKYVAFGEAFDNANYDRLKAAAQLTQVTVDAPHLKKEERDNPLAEFAKKKEGEEEEIMNEIKRVSNDPFSDLGLV